VLPQRIDRNRAGNVKLFFRVRNTFANCKIKVECDGQVLVERKKRICVPGEMETLILPEAKLKDLKGDIVLSLEV
jgi:hypothetical protein